MNPRPRVIGTGLAMVGALGATLFLGTAQALATPSASLQVAAYSLNSVSHPSVFYQPGDPNDDFDKGFNKGHQAGFAAGKESCKPAARNNLAPPPSAKENHQLGYKEGYESGFEAGQKSCQGN